jgi:hypothetical protein
MTEEENPEVAEAREEQAQVEQQKEEAQPNALYKTLFDVAEEVSEEVEEQPEYRPPVDLNEAVETLDHQPQEEAKEEEPQAEVKEEEPQKAEPKKKKLRKVVDPDIPEDVKKQPAFTSNQSSDEYRIEDEDAKFMEDLIPEERAMFEKVLYADKRLGGDYKGKAKQFKDFFKKNKDFVEKRMADDDFYDPATDDQYKEFISKNKPQFNRSDEDKVYREMILEEADKRINRKTSERIEQLEKQIQRQQTQPRINQAKAHFRKNAQKVIPEDINKQITGSETGLKDFAESNPLEYQIVEKNTQEMLAFSDALTDIFLDPNTPIDVENNQMHNHLNQWINHQQEQFIKTGQTQLDDGRTFMRRERFYRLPEDKRAEYYTWDDNAILNLLALTYKDKMQAEIATHRQAMEKAGYRKVAPEQQVQEPAPAPAPVAKPPVVNPSPRQGSSVETKQAPKQENALLATLGL